MKNQFSLLGLRIKQYMEYVEMSDHSKPTKKQKLFAQKLELFTYRDDFQEEVRFLRKRFGIPTTGYSKFDDCLRWSSAIIDEPQEYAKKDTLRAYAKLRERKPTTPFDEYEKMLRELLHTLAIGGRWFEAVEYYLLFNKIDAHEILPKSVVVSFIPDEITGENTLCLKVFADTEQRDILEWWRTIESFQGIIRAQRGLNVLDKQQALRAMSIDPIPHVKKQKSKKERGHTEVAVGKARKAYLLRQAGKTHKEIGQMIGCAQGQVGTYIGRYERLVKDAELN